MSGNVNDVDAPGDRQSLSVDQRLVDGDGCHTFIMIVNHPAQCRPEQAGCRRHGPERATFPDKAGLVAVVADRGFEMLRSVLVGADSEPDPREALFAQGMAFIDFARTNPALFQLMYSHQYGQAGKGCSRRL